MTRRLRMRVLSGFGVGAGLLALASTAFACTTFVGKATWHGNGTGNTDHSVEGNGASGMGYCTNHGPAQGTKVRSGASNGSLTVTLDASVAADCNNASTSMPTSTLTLGTSGATTFSSGFPTGTYDSCGTHGLGTVNTIGSNWSFSNPADLGSSKTFTASSGTNQYWSATGDWTVCLFNNNQAEAIGSWVTAV